MKIPSTISILKKYQIRPRKKFGQNFLTEFSIMEKIVSALDPAKSDEVLEIGPGLGIMSAIIAKQVKKIYAVEKDRNLFNLIEEEFGNIDNMKLFNADILEFDLKKELSGTGFPIKVVGNIPYNISTPILFKLLSSGELISCAVLTVQKEVAERMTAREGGKDYGILSIMLQTKAICKKLFDIKAGSFTPPPRVTSTVVKIDIPAKPLFNIKDVDFFEEVIKTAFGQRRKTIRNSLLGSKRFKIEKIDTGLKESKIDPKRRPETISIEEYVNLVDYLKSILAITPKSEYEKAICKTR